MAFSDNLRTNYQDAEWSGERKYQITGNSDGTSSVTDVTVYTREGDVFGSADINRTNTVIKEIESAENSSRRITLSSNGWSSGTTTIDGMALYTQVATVTAIYNDHPVISLGAAGTVPTAAEERNYAMLKAAIADVSTNRITFYATSKPTGTLYVIAKEVK